MNPENEQEQESGTEVYMTVRQMVAEIRTDVKGLKAEAARLAALPDTAQDHETRLRRIEVWMYGIPVAGIVAISSLAVAALTH